MHIFGRGHHSLFFAYAKERMTLVFWFFSAVFFISIFVAAFTSYGTAEAANPPSIITYQGKVLQSGASVTSELDMGFLIFDASSAGNLLYTAAGTLSSTSTISVTPTSGIFSVNLGGSGTNSLDAGLFRDNASLYLEVWIEGQALSPRKQLTAAPYALNSQYLGGMAATTTSSTTYIPHSDSWGNFTFSGRSQSSGVSGGIIYINPTSTLSDYALLGMAVNGSERFRVDEDGDTAITGGLSVSTTFFVSTTTNRVGVNSSTPGYTFAVNGTSYFTGTSTMANLFTVDGKVGNPTHAAATSSNMLNGIHGVVVSGNYAYTANGTADNIVILDISTSTHPSLVSSIAHGDGGALLDGPRALAVSGNYLYVASFTNDALEIIDISNPAAPVHKGSLSNGVGGALLDGPKSIAVSGNYAYIATNAGDALEIVDISDPANPVHKGSLANGAGGALLNDAYWVHVSGNYAYVASIVSDALEIVDISNPANPVHKGSLANGAGGALLDGPTGVFVSGNYAYVASSVSDALEIIDISNPASPVHKGSLSNGTGGAVLNDPYSVFVAGNYAYITSNVSDVLEIVDVSDPGNPRHKASLSNGTGGALLDDPTGLYVLGNYAYVASSASDALEIVNISGASISNASIGNARIDTLQTMSFAQFEQGVNIRGGLVVGSNGLLLSGDFGMSAATTTGAAYSMNATNTLKFSHRAYFTASSTNGYNYIFDSANTVANGTTFFSVRNNGTERFAISGNGNVGINSSTPGFALSVSGTSYFTGTSTYTNLVTIDGKIGNPLHFAATSSNMLDGAYNVFVSGNYAYVASDLASKLLVFDVSSSTNPTMVGSLSNGDGGAVLNEAASVYVAGNYAYVAAFAGDALEIVDISDPANPRHKGSLLNGVGGALLDGANDVFVSGSYAYIASQVSDALEIVDISDPANPRHKGSLLNGVGGALLDYANDIFVSGNYAYVVATDSNALEIIDVSDPAAPRHKGSLAHGSGGAVMSTPTGVFVYGNHAYIVSTGSDALEIVDVSDPANPRHKGSLSNGTGGALLDDPYSVFVSGNYAYITAQTSDALEIVDVSNPQNPAHKGSITHGSGGALLDQPLHVFVSGNYAYVVSFLSDSLEIVNVSGASISNASIGTAKVGHLQTMAHAIFDQSVNIHGGLMVGNAGLLLSGDFGMSVASSTTSTLLTATNTLKFSHRAYFTASSTKGLNFVFDTPQLHASTTPIFAVQNNGTSKFVISGGGNVFAKAGFNANSTDFGIGDVAEYVNIVQGETVGPGDVLVVDSSSQNLYRKSEKSHEQSVAGVISDTGAFIIGAGGANRAPLALAGIVNTKVSAENGEIKRGDLLVTSAIPGHAMRYNPAKDDGTSMVAILGVALDSFSTSTSSAGTGKIMALVKAGWVNNRSQTISAMQKELTDLAEARGVNLSASPRELRVVETESGAIVPVSFDDTDFRGTALLNVGRVAGANRKWEIDADGRFISRVATANGEKDLYALAGPSADYIFSGSGVLENGMRRVLFDDETRQIILATSSMKVNITLTSDAKGAYVTEKDGTGFTVRELGGGSSNATFDWVVIAPRRFGDEDESDAAGAEIQEKREDVTPDEVTTSTPESPADEVTEEAPLESPGAEEEPRDTPPPAPASSPVPDAPEQETPVAPVETVADAPTTELDFASPAEETTI